MISTIVDSNGFFVHKGDDVDAKFKTIIAKSGHSKGEDYNGSFIKAKWNGSEWVEGYVATYSDNRKEEYPTMPDQLDDIYHNGIDAWKATIKAIKDKYPKG